MTTDAARAAEARRWPRRQGLDTIETMGLRGASCDYSLLVPDGAPAGYGMTAVCPNGLGLIGTLFTLPEHGGRRRAQRHGRGGTAGARSRL